MTSQQDFLSLVLPHLQEGEFYCTLGIRDGRAVQKFASSVEGVCGVAATYTAEEVNGFFALAKFADQKRNTANAVALKSFFVDLDCGAGKPYPDLPTGMMALKDFCAASKLPKPTIVKSGNGAHLYWVCDEAIPRAQWVQHAERLKLLCTEHKFHTDPSVTADAARILRIPYTFHVKDRANPKLVEVLHVAPILSRTVVSQLLEPVVDLLRGAPGVKPPLDALTLSLMGNSQSRFKTILKKSLEGTGCMQIANAYTSQETLEEPLWRAALSIAQPCVDRDKAIHILSRKHPDYNAEVTEKKASETKGPYTCETFAKLAPALCEGCPHKFTSPIQLGKETVEATETDNTLIGVEAATGDPKQYVIPKYPFPFFRGKNGGIYVRSKDKDDNETEELVYAHDLYVVKRMSDPDTGEVILLRLHLPKDGVRDFIIPLGTVLSKDKFVAAISSVGVVAFGKKQETLMYYVVRSVEDMQNELIADKAYKQFGWTEGETSIIIGDRNITATDVTYSPPSTVTLPNIPFFQAKGSFHVWKDVINHYGTPGMENRAFAFFMGFGTLLMRLTTLDGFLLNLMSKESGSGKTTVLQVVNSIYGRPKELLLAPKDTYNSRMQRIGVMQNLAVTMDEITNMAPDVLSQQVYDVTSGRAKNRLKQHENAERLNHTNWQTGLITSSNRSVVDALLSIKGFPDGEIKRVIEMPMGFDPNNSSPTWARNHFTRLKDNYGHAIQPYAQSLVGQLPTVRIKLSEVQEKIDRALNIHNSERYWALMAAVGITGGAIAKQLKLHDIPIKPVFDFAVEQIKQSRTKASESLVGADDVVAMVLQRRFGEILVINGKVDKRTSLEHAPIKEPRGALSARYEPDTGILYVSTSVYRAECDKHMLNYEESLAQYKRTGALIMHGAESSKKKRLFAGTSASSNSSVYCLWFDTKKFKNSELNLDELVGSD